MSSPFFKRSVDDKLSLTGFDTSKSKFIHFADSVCKISDLRTHFPDTVWGNWSLKEKARRCLAFWLSLINVVLKVADSRPLKSRVKTQVETPVKIYREPACGVNLAHVPLCRNIPQECQTGPQEPPSADVTATRPRHCQHISNSCRQHRNINHLRSKHNFSSNALHGAEQQFQK